MNYTVLIAFLSAALALAGLGLGLLSVLARRREDTLRAEFTTRSEFLTKIFASERDLLLGQLQRERDMAAAERKELYSRIQAYDPNAGDFTPAQPSFTAPPSRPGDETLGPRSFTEEELGQMGLVEQADGMIRDSRSGALFETVEDYRFWVADLKKRGLPTNVHPEAVQELGWEEAVSLAKQQAAAKKVVGKN